MARPRHVPPAGLFERMRSGRGVIRSEADYRAIVLADLHDLLGSTRQWSDSELAAYPLVAASVLNFGTEARPGRVINRDSLLKLSRELHATIVRFDSRFDPTTLTITPTNHGDRVTLLIEGTLRGWPEVIPFFTEIEADFDSGHLGQTKRAA